VSSGGVSPRFAISASNRTPILANQLGHKLFADHQVHQWRNSVSNHPSEGCATGLAEVKPVWERLKPRGFVRSNWPSTARVNVATLADRSKSCGYRWGRFIP